MSEAGTTERVLRLLGLLQQRPVWTGPELATRLGVTTRSIRRDVDRLRALGYPVNATQGVGGGYQLGAGRALPPLLLDDEEAIATAVSLRLAAGGTVTGASEAAVRALTKLDQVLPRRLRAGVRALQGAIATLDGHRFEVDAEALLLLARACRDTVRIEFGYVDLAGAATRRRTEPYQLVATGSRWYLVAFDLDREDWRTFRLDRLRDPRITTLRFSPRAHPPAVELVQRAISVAAYPEPVRLLLHADAETVRRQVPATVAVIESRGPGRCLLEAGARDPAWVLLHAARLGHRFEVLGPAAVRELAAELGRRLAEAAGPSTSH
ncbi:YafY family protein [Nocardioides sp. BP30]|uniref:helix-turn-helix transcriptional regulator n=1 Tax=Nocardioides sp. BP30 TaxID=3036374 RepID=UPI00246995D1|nr:YafY family protein [Nocardioides sp. BP30]WGL51224.1 YafY family protein [Nocardioides sp. BP30]